MDFLVNNALLIGLAIGTGIALLWPMIVGGAGGVPSISATEAVLLLSRNKPLVLDVRKPEEFAEGHIQGAVNIPVADLKDRVSEIQKYKDKPVLVNCQKGMRSKAACGVLKAAEFTQIHNLEGGLDAWGSAKLPVVKPATS